MFEMFEQHFEAIVADSADLLLLAQRLRYQVYCIENGYEDPDAHPDAVERDNFDSHAVHGLLRHRSTGMALGTVRLILPLADWPDDSFAMQRLSGIRALKLSHIFPFSSTAEVSRFSLSRQLRRSADAQSRPTQPLSTLQAFLQNSTPLLRLGLIQSMLRMSLQNGITHWCAMMEPTLLRMLAAMAIRFEPIGAPVQHRGWRQPCYCNVADVMACVKHERPSFWDVLTAEGRLAY
jgi:N-acyl amino acid synthase of PEP-CTERM/exosortase system